MSLKNQYLRGPFFKWPLIVGITLALFAMCGCNGRGSSTNAAGKRGDGGAVPVVVANASQKDVPIDINVIGNVEAYSTITVRAQVGGQLMNVYFNEGDYVKKGERLFT